MAQITGNDYLNKYGSLPGGYKGSDYMTKMFDDPNPSPRTVDSNSYIDSVNNPTDYTKQINDLLAQQAQANKALMEAYAQPYQAPDYSKFLTPLKGPDYSSLQPLIGQEAGLRTQANQFQNTLEDLPQTLQALYRDAGIEQAQLDRTTAIQSEPIIKSLSRLLQSADVIGRQIERGQGMAKDQYGVDVQNRQFGLQGLQLQDQSARDAYNQRLKGLEVGANMPTQQIDVLTKLQQLMNPAQTSPKYEYFEDAKGNVRAFDPLTGQTLDLGMIGTPQRTPTGNPRNAIVNQDYGFTKAQQNQADGWLDKVVNGDADIEDVPADYYGYVMDNIEEDTSSNGGGDWWSNLYKNIFGNNFWGKG